MSSSRRAEGSSDGSTSFWRWKDSAAEYGRDVEVWMSSSIVVRPTERDALEYLDYYAVDHADLLGLASLQREPEWTD